VNRAGAQQDGGYGFKKPRAVLATLLLLLLPLSLHAATPDLFAEANAAYARADFRAAAKLYSKSLTQRQDENAWYNLGNAYFRLDDLGHAALAYERALVLSPGHPEAAANLRFVRQKSGARAADQTFLQHVLGAVPAAAANWLAIGVCWLGFLWAGLSLWRRTGLGGLLGGGLVLALGLAYAAGILWWRNNLIHTGIVVAASVQARNDPFDVAKNSEMLPAGTRLKRLTESQVNGAHLYQLPSGSQRWISSGGIDSLISS
jgi:tetratricopeptide (TPR) repeat protein